MFSIILLGGPGSGKGTQSIFISKELGFKCISTGDILRALITSQSSLGLAIKNITEKGNLLSDQMVSEIVNEEIKKNYANKLLIDGYPRTRGQAILLDEIIPQHKKLALLINVSPKILKERLIKRSLKQLRSDDHEKIIINRIQIYKENIKNIISFYKEKHFYQMINGEANVEEVKKEIYKNINIFMDSF